MLVVAGACFVLWIVAILACRSADTDTGTVVVEEVLVEGHLWTELSASSDLLSDHRPDPVECSASAWYPELGGLDIDTGLCNYVSLVQPSLAEIEVGDVVELLVWHQTLWAESPAEAHIAVMADAEMLWETYIGIPAQATVYEEEWLSGVRVPIGSEIVLHLHNHGTNNWQFNSLTVTH